jgi:hypothetical protein
MVSFDSAVNVPPEFTGTELAVPHPVTKGVLYLKLRDDPANTETLTLPVTLMTAPEAAAIPLPSAPATAQQPAQAAPAPHAQPPEQEPAAARAQSKAPTPN